MPSRLETYDDVAPTIIKESQILSTVFKFLRPYDYQPPQANPFYRSKRIRLIYWPGLRSYPRRTQSLAKHVGFPPDIPPSDVTYQAYLRGFKEHVETLLGPLCIPAGPLVQDYAALQHIPGLEPLTDPCREQNYTCFLDIRADLGALMRTRIRPPILDTVLTAYLDELPESLHALYHAWQCIRYRRFDDGPDAADCFFSFDEVGVTYLPNGYLFINWDAFMRCPFSPEKLRKKVKPEELYAQLLVLKSPHSLKKAIIPRTLPSVDAPAKPVEALLYKELDPYQKAIVDAGLPQTDAAFKGYYTIVDPYVLYQKDRLFDGRYVYTKREKRKETHRAAQARYRVGDDSKALVRVPEYMTLKARSWLTRTPALQKKAQECQWFPNDFEEPIYFVKHRKVLYFHHPEYIRRQRNTNEIAIFERALEPLQMVLAFTETGNLDYEPRKRSVFYEHLTSTLRKKAQLAFLEEYFKRHRIDKGETFEFSQRHSNRLISEYMEHKFKQDPSLSALNAVSGNWYNKVIALSSKCYLAPENVRIQLLTRLPEEEKPLKRTFWSPSAITMFHDFAQASLGLLKRVDAGDGFLGEILHGRPGQSVTQTPAPYIYAWACFCKHVLKDYLTTPQMFLKYRRNSDEWTPAEDFFLLTHYATRPRIVRYIHQKKTRYQGGPVLYSWEEILHHLPGRTEQTCLSHMNHVNSLLRKILTPLRYETHRFGYQPCTDFEAKRVIFLIGCMRFYPKHALDPNLPFVKYFFNLPDQALEDLFVPELYRKGYFAAFADLSL